MGVPYTFGTATTSIPLSNLDANFNTPVTIGNATVGLGNTVTTVGNLTLTNATISSGNVTVTTGIFGAGSNTAPSITTTGDTNTGIFFPAADTIAFTEGGVESMRIDSGGNVGLGVTPSAWSGFRAMQIGSTTSLWSGATAGSNASSFYTNNGFFNGTNRIYLTTGFATEYIQGAGQHIWYNAPSGTAGNAITFTQAMTLDASGNLGIGTTSPGARLDVLRASTNTTAFDEPQIRGINSATATASQRVDIVMRFQDGTYNGTGGISMIRESATARSGALTFAPIPSDGNGTERMRIDSSGNVGIGTSSPSTRLTINAAYTSSRGQISIVGASDEAGLSFYTDSTFNGIVNFNNSSGYLGTISNTPLLFFTNNAERMRITSGGNVLMATTSSDVADANGTGASFSSAGNAQFSRASGGVMNVNRKTDDGTLVFFQQDASAEGSISVSGTTVSYNGGHLSRWSQFPNNQKDNTLLKGTVMSNLDDMCVWTKDGEVLPNEQLNKMKISDVEGDTNVAGVFVSWELDEQCQSDDMNVAMTGDMIIRIADGVVVQKGDLLMSAGDGTAKPQGDDIVRSKTVAKVTSNHVTCTYADGSYCVPCVLMAC